LSPDIFCKRIHDNRGRSLGRRPTHNGARAGRIARFVEESRVPASTDRRPSREAGAALALALAAYCGAANAAGAAPRHVPSPDWRDQVVYFVMLDRFDDGDPANNDQRAGEFDPASGAHFSGGDLAGVRRRIDYIRGLGATAVWITPPVANQWWDDRVRYGGYHGYWAWDFESVDAHFGDLDAYRSLSDTLHRAGLYLVQDVVVNHTGNWFAYPDAWDPANPARGWTPNPDQVGRSRPAREPFSLNDPRDQAQRDAAAYHWTPRIRDGSDRTQELNWQLAELDDLNTENPAVRRALRRAYGHWIREVGVDAFRVDTAFYVPADYFSDFLLADDAEAPGVLRVAESTGRRQFHVFGEGFGIDPPFGDAQARRIDAYMRDARGNRLLPGMLNFPLYGTIADVFARGAPAAAMTHRIDAMMRLHEKPHLMPTFVDNHDVDRFLAGGTTRGLEQALLLIMTLPGIPTIYYGTEQGFTLQRGAMFAAGYGSGRRDRFDADAPLYRYVARATALRRSNPVFSRGTPVTLAANAAGPGGFAYLMRHADTTALVAFNTARSPALLDGIDTGLDPGRTLRPLFGIEGMPAEQRVGRGGRLTLELPPLSGQVWLAADAGAAATDGGVELAIDPLPQRAATTALAVSGVARGTGQFALVVDGDLARAVSVAPGADGRWTASVPTAGMVDESAAHRLVAWSPQHRVASPPREFRVAPHWRLAAQGADPAGDDRGPRGTYRYPEGADFSDNRPGDLRGVRAWTSGGALKVELRMHRVIATWNPPNGYDHVAFTLFVELPARDGGSTTMPLQRATLPAGMRWHYRLRTHGWSNALFDANGTAADRDGTAVVPGATIAVDRAAGTVTFTLPAAAFDHPRDLAGARLYVNTWDYDGGYRPLGMAGRTYGFRGGDGAREPLVLDDIAPLVLR
jgi:glycosidase